LRKCQSSESRRTAHKLILRDVIVQTSPFGLQNMYTRGCILGNLTPYQELLIFLIVNRAAQVNAAFKDFKTFNIHIVSTRFGNQTYVGVRKGYLYKTVHIYLVHQVVFF